MVGHADKGIFALLQFLARQVIQRVNQKIMIVESVQLMRMEGEEQLPEILVLLPRIILL
jgi:hypothetical protein